MHQSKDKKNETRLDSKEFELPETVYVRDIENRVFQSIVLQCLAKINDISLVEGNFIDHFIQRTRSEGLKGISAEQDSKNHSVKVRVEIAVAYGISIPEKALEIQDRVTEELTHLTGLHVSGVHVVFKNLIPQMDKPFSSEHRELLTESVPESQETNDLQYSDSFSQ